MQIDRVVELGDELNHLLVNQYVQHYCSVDPGFGSSRIASVLTEFVKEQDKIPVLYAEKFEHANADKMAKLCLDLHTRYQNTWFFVDGANRGFIAQHKVLFGEATEWEPDDIDAELIRVFPVNFVTEHKAM